jgi:hypothetical protein
MTTKVNNTTGAVTTVPIEGTETKTTTNTDTTQFVTKQTLSLLLTNMKNLLSLVEADTAQEYQYLLGYPDVTEPTNIENIKKQFVTGESLITLIHCLDRTPDTIIQKIVKETFNIN